MIADPGFVPAESTGTVSPAIFYAATILLLYSANDLSSGGENVLTRVFYDVVGITIGVLVVIYPFSRALEMINPKTKAE